MFDQTWRWTSPAAGIASPFGCVDLLEAQNLCYTVGLRYFQTPGNDNKCRRASVVSTDAGSCL